MDRALAGLTFVTLPKVFAQMTAGWVFGAIFFCLLSVAAVTSSISMLEVPVSYFVDDKPKARKKAATMVGIFAFLIGIPSAMANGGSEFFSNMELMGKTGFLDIMDQVFGTLCLIVISLSLSIYVGWIWKTELAVKEISEGCPWFTQPMVAGISPAQIWAFFVKYICPWSSALCWLTRSVCSTRKHPSQFQIRNQRPNRRRLRKRLLKITQALRRNSFRAFVEFEDFHGYHAVIVDFLERGANGLEIHVAEARALEVFVVGVEVTKFAGALANDVGIGFPIEHMAFTSRITLKWGFPVAAQTGSPRCGY